MNKIPFLKKKKVEGECPGARARDVPHAIRVGVLEKSRKIKANDPDSNAAKEYAVGAATGGLR